MKKLILSLAIISSNIIGYSTQEEQLCSAVNNCDVKKTKDLINKIGEVNAELKITLVKSAQNNIEHYQNASKFILLSPRDTANFILNGAIIGGSSLLANYCLKKQEELKVGSTLGKIGFAVNDFFGLNTQKMFDFVQTLEAKKALCIAGITTATVAALISSYKCIKSLNCNSAANKLTQAQAVYGLVSEIKVKEKNFNSPEITVE